MSEAPILLRQANALKELIINKSKDVIEFSGSRQKLQEKYERVLLLDLEYALDRKVEQDLWNNCFKNQITAFQTQAKDKQNVKRTEAQTNLSVFLECSSGFYLQLLQEICDIFKLDVPFRRKASLYGVLYSEDTYTDEVKLPKKSSCLYISQYCLVHLGDIARYRQQIHQAETFYRHAAQLIPVNGHPYNQLAILEASRGNRLSTVFYYVRSLALKCPFSLARTNLEQIYAKISKNRVESNDKHSQKIFVEEFLRFNAFVHLASDVSKTLSASDALTMTLSSHVTNGNVAQLEWLQIISILLYTLSNTKLGSDPKLDSDDMSENEKRSYELLFKFIVFLLETLLVHTPKSEIKSRDYFSLGSIKIVIEWLRLDEKNFTHKCITSSIMWPHLAKLLNCLQPMTNRTEERVTKSVEDDKQDVYIALPEDIYLRGFLPLEKVQSKYTFLRTTQDDAQQIKLRCKQLINFGVWVSQNFASLLSIKEERNGRYIFTSTIPTVTFSADSPSPEKRGRQNIAMQTIMQNRTSSDSSPSLQSLHENDGSLSEKTLKHGQGIDDTKRNSAPTLFNAKYTSKPANGVAHTVRKQIDLKDQPIQTSSQNPGLIQIGVKDIDMIEKATQNTQKVTKHYRNIAPRHRNKVPESLQHTELEKHMEDKPFCAHKESWPALGETDRKIKLGQAEKNNYAVPKMEPQQILQNLPHLRYPLNIPVPNMGVPQRYTIQPEGKRNGDANVELTSHRYSTMNRTDSQSLQEVHPDVYHGDPLQVQTSFLPSDVNNSSNILQHARFTLPGVPVHNMSQPNYNPNQTAMNTNPMATQFSISAPVPMPQQHHPSFRDIRSTLVTPGFSPSFPLPNMPPNMDSEANVTRIDRNQQLSNKVGNPLATQFAPFLENPRPTLFPTMGFMISNPPPPMVAANPPTGMHLYDLESAPQLPNGELPPSLTNPASTNTQSDADKSGTYSLFSGGPWTMHISSAADSKNLGTSPFKTNSSAAPNPQPIDQTANASTKPTLLNEWGVAGNSHIQTSMQSLWNMPAPSPLQRLLEQQRQQRQTDPH